MSNDIFEKHKAYLSELKTIKDDYLKEKVQTFNVHKDKFTIGVYQDKWKDFLNNMNDFKLVTAAIIEESISDLKSNYNKMKLKTKLNKYGSYVILAGIVALSGYGLYLILKPSPNDHGNDHHLRNCKSCANQLSDSELNEDGGALEAFDFKRQQQQMASRYNKSNFLSRPNPSNKLVKIKNSRQQELNDLLNFIETNLRYYPRILNRPLKTINSRCIDARSQFRIMQWNGLAKSLSKGLKSPNVPDEIHEWENFRKWRVLEELVRYNCDIICVQEADFYEEIKPFIHKLGYASVFCPKMLSNLSKESNNVDPDGCAIFYNLDCFQITQLRSQSICLPSMGEHESQVFILIQLRHKFTKKRVTIVCVHLKAFQDFSQKRTEQTEYIMNILKEHILNSSAEDIKSQSVVICGDFNGTFTEPFYNTIVKSDLFKLKDVYPKNSSVSKRQRNSIDFIFHSENSLNLMNYLEMNPINKKSNGFEIPSLEYPSDHFSLVCDFQIK